MKIAKHAMVNLTDIINLNACRELGYGYDKLSARVDDWNSVFADQTLAGEWAAAKAVYEDLTRTADGASPAGGVNPGDQRAIFSIVRRLKPKRVLEVGTHLGYSTIHIAQALKLNHADGAPLSTLTTVDILNVNDSDQAPWRRARAPRSPRDAITRLGYQGRVTFAQSPSVEFLETTTETFDFVFLDGDHGAATVYEEVQLLQRVLEPGATVLLHDYFPSGRSLWKGSLPNTGPWRAIRRLQSKGAPIRPAPLGALPWPTKMGSNLTSLALLERTPAPHPS